MYYFLVNQHGGSGKAVKTWNKVKAALDKRGVEYETIVPEYAGHATVIARELSKKNENDIRLVIVGGDGTINEVVNGIEDFSRISLGVIPTGSGNDFARGLKLPRSNPVKALKKILECDGNRKIDLGKSTCNGSSRLFAISSGFGLDALVGTQINTSKIKTFCNKLHMGSASYSLLTIKVLFTMQTMKAKVKFDDGETVDLNRLIFMSGMNCFAEGGGVPMAPKALPDDGKLSVCMAYGIPKFCTFLCFPLLAMGLHTKLKGFRVKDCSWFEVESDIPTVMNTDGEFIGESVKGRMEILPSKLRVLC